MTPKSAYEIARRISRRMQAVYYKPSQYYEGGWRRSSVSLTVADKALAGKLDELGIRKRADRGMIRRMLKVAHVELYAKSIDTKPTLAGRLNRRLTELALDAAQQLPAGAEAKHFDVRHREDGLTLVVGSWWYEYSRRHGSRKHEVAILHGKEDGQRWSRRVPPSCATVTEALDYVRPAAVNAALADGREVLRQGDVWLVRLQRGRSNLDALRGTNHELDGTVLRHPEHGDVDLGEAPWRAYLSKDTTRPMTTSARFD